MANPLSSKKKIGKLPTDIHELIAEFAGPAYNKTSVFAGMDADDWKIRDETYRSYLDQHRPGYTIPDPWHSPPNEIREYVRARDEFPFKNRRVKPEYEKNRDKLAKNRIKKMLGKGSRIKKKK